MAGGIIQIVTNTGPQNQWLNTEPEITFFKKIYRRHTNFATEQIPIPFNCNVDFGGGATARILPKGDGLYRTMFVCDIPKLAAAFLNTKVEDLAQLISKSNLSDPIFRDNLRKYLSINSDIEFGRTLDQISSRLGCYAIEESTRRSVLVNLSDYTDPIGITGVPSSCAFSKPNFNPNNNNLDLPEIPPTINQLNTETDPVYNFVQFKSDLANMWVTNKKQYYLIYEYLRLIYGAQNTVINDIPIVNTNLLSNTILYSSIFANSIPNREILLGYDIFTGDFTEITSDTNNSLIDAFDTGLIKSYEDFVANFPTYEKLNQLYTVTSTDPPINNPDFLANPLELDSHTLLKNVSASVNNNYAAMPVVQDQFYAYGPHYHYMVNTYNSIINILKNYGTTAPTIICKSYKLGNLANIYTDAIPTTLTQTYQTFIDPNFKSNFLFAVNNSSDIFPNKFVNEYLNYFNSQSNMMFISVQNSMDKLFKKYSNTLFSSTKSLFYLNTPPLANIYDYQVPTAGYHADTIERIDNVFNLNIWFFHFFSYLSTFNEVNYTNYINNRLGYTFGANALLFMTNLITLLKSNVNFYMKEISYMLNDLLNTSPSVIPGDTMKNYVPKAFSNIINGININTDLLGVTMIFHRNQVQSITEIFQFIYYFIEKISIQKINIYLGTTIGFVSPNEESYVRKIVKLFYYKIYENFMNVYDSMQFEAPAKYSTSDPQDFSQKENIITKQYVDYFLYGQIIQPMLTPLETQTTLQQYVRQMEFYFTAEMINQRSNQRLYFNLLYNLQLINSNVGSTTAQILAQIRDSFIKINDGQINTDIYNNIIDRTRRYYDDLYQSNILSNKPDNLYYTTFDIDRFNGQPYNLTSYQSRNYGTITAPIAPATPLPPTNPYGINPDYYNSVNVAADNTPVYWVNDIAQPYQVITTDPVYQIYPIDYFRIKHSIFFNPDIPIPLGIKFIDEYQSNILRGLNLLERLLTEINTDTVYWAYTAIDYLRINTDPTVLYVNYLGLYPLPMPVTYVSLLTDLSTNLINYYNGLITAFPPNLILESVNCLKSIFSDFNNSVFLQVGQQTPYINTELVDCNRFTYNSIISVNPLTDPIFSNFNVMTNVEIIRDNFLSQYFYFAKYINSIRAVDQYSSDTNIYSFFNMTQISFDILSRTNYLNINLDLFRDLSPLVYLYPDVFGGTITQLNTLITTLDDFSQSIVPFITSELIPNTAARLTFKDIYDSINISFSSVEEIYQFINRNTIYDLVVNGLRPFQPLLLDKLSVFNEINRYINRKGPTDLFTLIDATNIATLVAAFSIDFTDYYNYLVANILPEYNNLIVTDQLEKKFLLINILLESDLDYFFLRWVRGDATVVFRSVSFKYYILNNLNIGTYPDLYNSFLFIDNTYYAFILFFLEYARLNNLTANFIENPVGFYDRFDYVNQQPLISAQYSSFGVLANIIEYFMDYVWDFSMTICDADPLDSFTDVADFGFGNRPSIIVNQIHQEYLKNITDKLSELNADRNKAIAEEQHRQQLIDDKNSIIEFFKNKAIDEVINAIRSAESKKSVISSRQFEVSEGNFYVEKLTERAEIIKFINSVAVTGLDILRKRTQELQILRTQIANILYRNKRAKTAWIHKLAHFMIEEVSIIMDDQEVDKHDSDWLETFHEYSKQPGTEPGYLKMIGHREDLIIYDDKLKNSYTIVMPFVFYHCRNPVLMIPLTASLNTKYEINVKIRQLSDLTYKEQFADFIDPDIYDNIDNQIDIKPFIPSVSNSYLMCEYIYLDTEERMRFVSQMLEYIMEDTQIGNTINITDNNLIPVFKIGTVEKTVDRIVDGRKTKVTFFVESEGDYVDRDELSRLGVDTNQFDPFNSTDKIISDYTLLPRRDIQIVPFVDQTGGNKTIAVNKPLPFVNKFVHYKRIDVDFNFHNPTELFILTIQPNIHVDPIYRFDESNYYFGEKQWDNYSLYSRYDLSAIQMAKNNYYNDFEQRLDDINDPIFGFEAILNTILLEYDTNPVYLDTRVDIWIQNNLSYFLQVVMQIKDAYINFTGELFNIENSIRLKENLISQNYNYNIYDTQLFIQTVTDIFNQLQITSPSIAQITTAYSGIIPGFDINNFNMDRQTYTLGIYSLLQSEIQLGSIAIDTINSAISTIYTKYNEIQINVIINTLRSLFNLDILTYNFYNAISYLNATYTAGIPDPNILQMIQFVLNALSLINNSDIQQLDTYVISELDFKQIIYQILPIFNVEPPLTDYLNIIPIEVIGYVTYIMNRTRNNLINKLPVELIDYQQNMKLNPKVNPLIGGYLSFNQHSIMPENSDSKLWSEVPALKYLQHTPSDGINLYSWSLNPLYSQHMGSANLTRIDEFHGNLHVSPLISNNYPATIKSSVMSVNMIRYLGGMGGKMWLQTGKKF